MSQKKNTVSNDASAKFQQFNANYAKKQKKILAQILVLKYMP